MEILDANAGLLSNYEVLSILREKKEAIAKQSQYVPQNLATVTYEVTKYLQSTPCSVQNEDIIKEFLLSISKFKLTKAEKLMLLNLRPTTLVELHLVIEETEERFSESDCFEMLKIISEVLPPLHSQKTEGTEAKNDDSEN